jgi:hypothetical protein
MRLKADAKFRRRRLKRLCEGILGTRFVCSRRWLSNSVSTSQPRHSPTKAIVINSLSPQTGSGPGRRNSGLFRCQMSSTTTYVHVQESSKQCIMLLSSGAIGWFSSTLPLSHQRTFCQLGLSSIRPNYFLGIWSITVHSHRLRLGFRLSSDSLSMLACGLRLPSIWLNTSGNACSAIGWCEPRPPAPAGRTRLKN